MKRLEPEREQRIKTFVDAYYREHHISPSVREIAGGTGISPSAVQRFLTDLKKRGEIDYEGRRGIRTAFSRAMGQALDQMTMVALYDASVSCGVPTEVAVEPAEMVPLPTSLLGSGSFFMLRARGDSMTGAGIDDGDWLLVRQQSDCRDGACAVVLVNGCETLLKTVTHLPEQQGLLLHAENPAYPDRVERDVRIQGVAVKVIKSLNGH